MGNATSRPPVMTGDSGAGGASGLIPAPTAGDGAAKKSLRADGTWQQNKAPTITYLKSGSGTYNTPAGCIRLEIEMVGGGGGGGGYSAAGNDGQSTYFDTVYANYGGGSVGYQANYGVSAGGSGGTGAANLRIPGGGTTNSLATGQTGASSMFGAGGAGGPLTASGNGVNANANSGAGGGGCRGGSATTAGAPGGGSGEYVEFSINNPNASYNYRVGTGGAGGSGTYTGGNGGSGLIIVREFYS